MALSPCNVCIGSRRWTGGCSGCVLSRLVGDAAETPGGAPAHWDALQRILSHRSRRKALPPYGA